MGTILIIIVVGGLIGGILIATMQSKQNESRKNQLEAKLLENKDLELNKKIEGFKNFFLFGVDQKNEKIAYITPFRTYKIPFQNIIGVELIEDGAIISKKSATRTIGGAVIGGVLAGGVGTIVGGLSGSSTQKNKVSTVKVKILLRDISNPSLEINCFDSKTMTTEGKSAIETDGKLESWIYKKGKKDAQDITDTINVIIDLMDKNIPQSEPQNFLTNNDELNKNSNNIDYELIKLKSEGNIIKAVQLCVKEKNMTLAEANEFVKNI
jgi:hypothetical protein